MKPIYELYLSLSLEERIRFFDKIYIDLSSYRGSCLEYELELESVKEEITQASYNNLRGAI